MTSLRSDGAPAPPPHTHLRPFINTTLMHPLRQAPRTAPPSITAFPILSNTLSLFPHVFFSSERRKDTSVCLIDKINGGEEKNTITYEETLEKVLKRRRIPHGPAASSPTRERARARAAVTPAGLYALACHLPRPDRSVKTPFSPDFSLLYRKHLISIRSRFSC